MFSFHTEIRPSSVNHLHHECDSGIYSLCVLHQHIVWAVTQRQTVLHCGRRQTAPCHRQNCFPAAPLATTPPHTHTHSLYAAALLDWYYFFFFFLSPNLMPLLTPHLYDKGEVHNQTFYHSVVFQITEGIFLYQTYCFLFSDKISTMLHMTHL